MGSRSKHQTKILLVHPGSLGHHSAVFLRLEPLGLELVGEACRKSGYSVRLLDLQASSQQDYFRLMEDWHPDAVGFSLNYLANIPEVIDLAKQTRQRWGHASFSWADTAPHLRLGKFWSTAQEQSIV
jgi:hypothetical protein